MLIYLIWNLRGYVKRLRLISMLYFAQGVVVGNILHESEAVVRVVHFAAVVLQSVAYYKVVNA